MVVLATSRWVQYTLRSTRYGDPQSQKVAVSSKVRSNGKSSYTAILGSVIVAVFLTVSQAAGYLEGGVKMYQHHSGAKIWLYEQLPCTVRWQFAPVLAQ